MSTLAATLLAVVFSSAALFFARSVNPKRRRVLKQTDDDNPMRHRLAWLAAIVPGAALIALGNVAALICWFAVITVIGWLVAMQGARKSG